MSRTRVHGRVGAYASTLMWKAWGGAALLAVIAVVTAKMTFDEQIPFMVGAGVCAALGLGMSALGKRGSRARIGVVSERRALRALRKAGLAEIVCGAYLGSGGDVDLVGLGPQALAIEVKTGRGQVSIGRDGKLMVGRRVLVGNPLGQAKRGAAAVGRALGTNVVGVVCVVDMTQRPLVIEEREATMWVCAARDLESVVAAQLPRLSADEAAGAAERLVELSEKQRAAQREKAGRSNRSDRT